MQDFLDCIEKEGSLVLNRVKEGVVENGRDLSLQQFSLSGKWERIRTVIMTLPSALHLFCTTLIP